MPETPEEPEPVLALPDEHRFDVRAATLALEKLASATPDAPILLEVAELDADGLGEIGEVRLRAIEAAALLATVGENQQIKRPGPPALFVLAVRTAPKDERQAENRHDRRVSGIESQAISDGEPIRELD